MDENQNAEKPSVKIMQVLKDTPPLEIVSLDVVKNKYITNYNYCHKDKVGELMYHRQLIHFNQIISNSSDLKNADKFSLYACFLTAAVNGDSFDPNDEETYLVPLKGKAYLWPQVKSRVKRLRNSGQIKFADQARLVYKGDIFEVENGRVLKHVEKFETETIIAGYVRFVIDEKGNDKFFIYRKTDWEAWKQKSQMKTGDNWAGGGNGQPLASFLRTKIIKHACADKSWSSDRKPAMVEQFQIEIDDPTEIVETTSTVVSSTPYVEPVQNQPAPPQTIVHNNEDEGKEDIY